MPKISQIYSLFLLGVTLPIFLWNSYLLTFFSILKPTCDPSDKKGFPVSFLVEFLNHLPNLRNKLMLNFLFTKGKPSQKRSLPRQSHHESCKISYSDKTIENSDSNIRKLWQNLNNLTWGTSPWRRRRSRSQFPPWLADLIWTDLNSKDKPKKPVQDIPSQK